jgi:hypothetical protein
MFLRRFGIQCYFAFSLPSYFPALLAYVIRGFCNDHYTVHELCLRLYRLASYNIHMVTTSTSVP